MSEETQTIAKRIKQFNSGRNPDVLQMKYKNMRSNAFVFYRGSCHLFYEDLPSKSFFDLAPPVWVCGDLHLENFGCYQADNRGVYFDINDFDESVLAPCLWDVARLLTSLLLSADTLKIDLPTAVQLCKHFLKTYTQTLQAGSARLMEEKFAQGTLKKFLESVSSRKRKEFINSRTVKIDDKRKLLINAEHVCKIGKAKKQQIKKVISEWAKTQQLSEFDKVLDVGYRIAGTGSLGLERYVLLVKGKGAEKHHLLDMKIANPSCLTPYLKMKQPFWKNEADRVIQIQRQMQIFPQALLSAIKFDKQWFVLKELQPSQDKMDLTLCKGKVEEIKNVIETFAEILAWDQLRSGGRSGSATADELIHFASIFPEWGEELMNYSMSYARQVQKDFKEFSMAYDAGYFND